MGQGSLKRIAMVSGCLYFCLALCLCCAFQAAYATP